LGREMEGWAFKYGSGTPQGQKIEMNFHVWNCKMVEVVEMKLVFVLKYRSLPFGKGEGGMGFLLEL